MICGYGFDMTDDSIVNRIPTTNLSPYDNGLDASISLIDHLNPGCGYQVVVTDSRTGSELLSTSRHPATGAALLTFTQCVEVLGHYTVVPHGIARKVHDYYSGNPLIGTPSRELCDESDRERIRLGTGAVLAARDSRNVWQFVDRSARAAGDFETRTVYVAQ